MDSELTPELQDDSAQQEKPVTLLLDQLNALKAQLASQPKYSIPDRNKECPPYDDRKNYYQEFWKIYIENQMLIKQIRTATASLATVKTRIIELEDSIQQVYNNRNSPTRKKKNRRPAVEISKDYKCPYLNCYKTYGSDVSMNLHIKIKHSGGNKTERQKLAKQIIMAERKNLPLPQIHLNFPPNYLQEFRAQAPQQFKQESSISNVIHQA